MNETPSPYSLQVLEETPDRVTRLLSGFGSSAVIRALMHQAGMKADDILEGRTLLLAVLATPESMPSATDSESAKASRAAVTEIDEWDEPNFGRYGATLRRHFPEAFEYVFRDLAPSTGVTAIRGVATFLLRVEALAKGSDPARSGSKQSDAKAVALLASRNLGEDERARLSKLVELALGPTDAIAITDGDNDNARLHKLTQLKDWYEEWATIARAVIKKRSHLIRLGLAQRKARKGGPGGGEGGGSGTPPA